MRRLFLAMLLVLGVAASLAYLVRLDAGYVLLQFQGVSVETTVWVASLLLLLGLFAFYYLSRLLVLLADLLSRLLGRRAPRRAGGLFGAWHARQKGATTRGALALIEGRPRDAMRLLARGAKSADAPLLNYLLAARASEEMGDEQLVEGFYQLAGDTPGSVQAMALERARWQIRRGEYAAALGALDAAAQDGVAASPGLLRTRLEILEKLQDWPRIGALLGDARKHAALPAEALDTLEERCHLQLLGRARAQAESLQSAWQAMPAKLRQRPAMLARYAPLLARAGYGDDAAKLLCAALKKDWDSALIRSYGQLEGGDVKRRLVFAESLLGAHPRDPQLLLALGRIALQNRLWGKAREYLEGSLAAEPGVEVFAELARLCESMGETERAHLLLQRAVGAAVGELAALPQPDGRARLTSSNSN